MQYVWMLIVGIVVGAIARLIMPGNANLGLLMTGVTGWVDGERETARGPVGGLLPAAGGGGRG